MLTIPKIDAMAAARGPNLISFAGGTPHPSDLPIEQLAGELADAIDETSLAYSSSRGEPEVLDALQGYFGREGVDASPERTIYTGGAMAGLDLVFRNLLEPGDVAIVESPTYSDSLVSLSLSRARIEAIPVDSEGAVVDALGEAVARAGRPPRLIYVIPTFQNPSGVTLTHERRLRLIELARELGAVLVEDDAYSPFRFDGPEVPSLAALSPEVVSVRSLSKVVAPGLRPGCVIGPADLIDSLIGSRAGVDICPGALNQRLVARFIGGGAVYPHRERLTALFHERRNAMLEALESSFSVLGATWTRPEGGMFIWVDLPSGFDTRELLEPALEEGVAFVPGSLFSQGDEHASAMRLCFAGVETERVAEGIERLARACERTGSGLGADV